MGQLVAKKYPTPLFLKLADHTYVECGNGACGWGCWGGKAGGMAFHAATGSTRQANEIAGSDEHGGITCYLINGVCHQAANRILFPAKILVTGARGYRISEALFGPYGRPRGFLGFCNAPFIRHDGVTGDLPECGTEEATLSGTDLSPDREQRRYIEEVAAAYAQIDESTMMSTQPSDSRGLLNAITGFQVSLFQMMMNYRLGPDFSAQSVQANMVSHRVHVERRRFALEEEFASGAIDVDEFTSELNKAFVTFQHSGANTLSESDYQRLFGAFRGEEIWLGDPNIARSAYDDSQRTQ